MSGYRFTAIDVQQQKRNRAAMLTRAAWYEIKETLKRMTSRTRADAGAMSSVVAVFGLTTITAAIA